MAGAGSRRCFEREDAGAAAGCRAGCHSSHSSRREGAEGEARGAARRPSLALPLFVVALSALARPGAAQVSIPQYTNISRIAKMLGTSWAGAGYDSSGEAHYLYRPDGDFTEQDCAPRTGRPSKCVVEQLLLDLKNPPPPGHQAGAKYLNFTMRLHGNVFDNSPGAAGFFEMPAMCYYERNHSVLAMFNISRGDVEFTILNTHSDKLGCGMDTPDKQPDRCTSGRCHPTLDGLKFKGKFRLGPKRSDDVAGTVHHLELILFFPYKHAGPLSFSDPEKRDDDAYVPQMSIPAEITSWATKKESQIFRYSLTAAPQIWKGPEDEWFRDRRPKIHSVFPPFGPEEGGSVVTVRGVEFPEPEAGSKHNASITLQHGDLADENGVLREWGGQLRECCETRRLSDTEVTCRLPRISCLHNNKVGKCSKPGADFANQTVAFAIKPSIKGFYAEGVSIPAQYNYPPPFDSSYANGIDDFVAYEGTWELEDNDLYGGTFVSVPDRVPGETHILGVDQDTASSQFCCPVCKSELSDKSRCRIVITQLSAGIYDVTIPAFLYPGGVGKPEGGMGVCDPATNLKNSSLQMGIERSTDPTGFTPANPLSITSCIDMRGACANVPRISIRESCKQLVWSTGAIQSRLPIGQTVEVHEWVSNTKCDRRMRCVDGPCKWTNLASDHLDRTPENYGDPLFQRRQASPQVGLEVQYRNDAFSPDGFLGALAALIPAPGIDPRRLQILHFAQQKSVPLSLVGTTFAVREFQPSESSLCLPEVGRSECVDYNMIIYITSDGPMGPGFDESLGDLVRRARSPKGDPDFRTLNLMRVCVDQSWEPDKAAQGLEPDCIKVQYPGFLQFLETNIRAKEEIWSYAKIGVTRTGGSDLGVTLDYETVEMVPATEAEQNMYALGLGIDYTSKQGQLRWLEGDDATKFIIVPIRWDGITELAEMFQVRIFNSINAKLSIEPRFGCNAYECRSNITIVGINDTPEPRYIRNMTAIIGAVCGAATAVPCALLIARFIRSVRRSNTDPNKAMDDDDDDQNAMAMTGDDGGFM